MQRRRCSRLRVACDAPNRSSSIMALRVGRFWRWTAPFVVLGTTAMFLYSHIVHTTSEEADIEVAPLAPGAPPTVVKHLNMFDFCLANTLKLMWNSGSKPLCVIIAFCSVLWIYTKLAMMAIVWLAPLPRRSVGIVLTILDVLGKWSFVDLYCGALYQTQLVLKLKSLLQLGEVKLGLHSDSGAFVFLTALILAIGITNMMVIVHRHDVMHATKTGGSGAGARGAGARLLPYTAEEHAEEHAQAETGGLKLAQALFRPTPRVSAPSAEEHAQEHERTLPDAPTPAAQQASPPVYAAQRASSDLDISRLVLPPAAAAPRTGALLGTVLLAGAVLASGFAMVYLLFWAHIMQFVYSGIFGEFVPLPERTVQLTLWSWLCSLRLADFDPDSGSGVDVGQWYFVTVGFIITFAAQIVLTPALLAALLLPAQTRPRLKEGALHAAQLLMAWACTDVFCVGMGVACFYMQRIATYTMEQQPEDILVLLVDFCGNVDSCFKVEGTLLPQFWIVVLSCVVTNVGGSLIFVRAKKSLLAAQSRGGT